MTHLPIACSLGAADFATRQELIAELGRDALTRSQQTGPQAELRFAAGAGIRDRVDAFIAAESGCCPFLVMHVAQADDEIVLTIDAPADADQTLAELVRAFSPDRQGA